MVEPRDVWAKIAAAQAEERAAVALESGFSGSPGLIYNESSGLGGVFRLLALREALSVARNGAPLGRHFESFYAEAIADDTWDVLPRVGTLRKWFGLNDSNPISESILRRPELAELFCALLHKRYEKTKGCVDAKSLFSEAFFGPRAYEEYLEWICVGTQVRTATGFLPHGRVLVDKTGERHAAVDRAQQAIEGPHPIVVNLYQRSMPNGLTAVAGTLIARQAPGRRILYLPLRQMGRHYPAPSLERVIGYIDAFLKGHDVTKARAVLPTEVASKTQALRLAMAKDPVILILDGYVTTESQTPHLERAIKDDNIIELVQALSEAPIGDGQGAVDVARYAENRIVLISDREVRTLSAGKPIDVPLPDETDYYDVLAQQSLAHADTVSELLDEHTDITAAASEAVLHLLDALVTVERPDGLDGLLARCSALINDRADSGVPTGDDDPRLVRVAHALLDAWKRRHRDCYEVLTLIALAPEGLRPSTLRRLIGSAGRSRGVKSESFAWLARIADPEALCRTILELGQAFIGLRADTLSGMDGHPHLTEFSVHRQVSPAAETEAELTLDFSVVSLRAAILSHQEDFAGTLQPYLRLLAEEAISQQTVFFRHAGDVASARDFRRLIAGVFHGARSLKLSNGGRIVEPKGIQNPEFAIPEVPAEAWEWLYLFAYRRMMESPPDWTLSRHFGEDGLKNDLLKLVNRPWIGWPSHVTRPIDPAGVIMKMPRSPRQAKLALDYHLALSQSYYALGLVPEAKRALSAAEAAARRITGKSPAPPGRASRTAWLPNPRLTKKKLDLALVDEDFTEAKRIVTTIERGFRSDVPEVLNYLTSMESTLLGLVSAANFADVVEGLPSATTAAEAFAVFLTRLDQPDYTLAQISGLIFRIGEYYALRADIANSKVRQLEMDAAAAEAKFDGAAYAGVTQLFCRSMAYFRLAEASRLHVFSQNPTGSNFFASGHSARQMVRVGLKLEQLARRALEPADNRAGFYARRARHMANVMTRHLYRYPRERAGMLILEASIARLLSARDADRLPGLESARHFLHHAETLVQQLGSGARVRMRLLLERIKVHRRLARLHGERREGDKASQFLAYAREDLRQLQSLADRSRLALWGNLVDIQTASVEAVADELAGKPAPTANTAPR